MRETPTLLHGVADRHLPLSASRGGEGQCGALVRAAAPPPPDAPAPAAGNSDPTAGGEESGRDPALMQLCLSENTACKEPLSL